MQIEINAAGQKVSSTLGLIRSSRERLRARSQQKIVFSEPYLLFQDKGLIYPSTINLIQGKTGTHKSRLVELICAALLARSVEQVAKFSWIRRSNVEQKFRVVYIDTERNERDQLPYALQQIKHKAGFNVQDDLPNFDYFSLIQVPRTERHYALELYMQHELKQQPGEEVVIILDVITDCISNFNDSSDSMLLLDFLNRQISDHNITFISVIHENPTSNSNKPRGHVGTELQNKSSSQLQIGFEQDAKKHDTELIKVDVLKNRVGARQQPVFLRYDADKRGLVLAEDTLIRETVDSRRTKLGLSELLEYLADNLTEPTTNGDLLAMVMAHFGCSRSTALDRIKELVYDGNKQLAAARVEGPRLEKVRQGRKELYSIVLPTVYSEKTVTSNN